MPSLARTSWVALAGVTGHVVQAEADIANGLAGMILAGQPDTALREARGTGSAPSSAAASSGPQRTITVGLSPASPPERGSCFALSVERST